ncbi:MAG: hypothetical protein DRP81_02575 [Candidatus Omnitrophota bacterium]|nr:MAG: hypothetical protein DRP81_02575 [Candidatus Omnitrophota bacterium]HDN86050.1 hypothetical protein [Candidatus Omnitrophota bacterium]
MLWYIIDGWNLINKLKELKNAPSPCEALLFYIKKNNLTGSKNNKVTVVFDGRSNFAQYNRGTDFNVVFSGERSADDVIKKEVSRYRNKKQIVVVSDDWDIINYVKSEGAGFLKVKDFLKKRRKKPIHFYEKVKEIELSLQKEITQELKRIWLKE